MCYKEHTTHDMVQQKKNKSADIMIEIIMGLERWNRDINKNGHRQDKERTALWKHPSIIKQEPQFVWDANYGLGPYSMSCGCGLEKKARPWCKKKSDFEDISPCSDPVSSMARFMSHDINNIKSCGVFSPRLGLLFVFLPPRIFKKPFPKDERAFFEPKLSSSAEAGKVAEGPMGGFSLVFLVSSFVYCKNKENIL